MTHLKVMSISAILLIASISFALDNSVVKENMSLRYPGYENTILTPPPLVGQIPAPDGAPRGITFDGQYLWVANSGDGNSQYGSMIYKIDPTNGNVVASFSSPGGDGACGFAWDGQYLWHSNYMTNTIYKLNPANGQVVSSFPSPGDFPFDLAWDGAYLYEVAGNTDIILKVDVSNGSAVDTIVCTYSSPNLRPFGLAYLPFESGQIWTSDGGYGSNLVNEYDFATSSWIDQWAANPTQYPCGLGYDPSNGYLFVSCWTMDSIYIYDVGTPTSISERDSRLTSPALSLSPSVTSGRLVASYDLNTDCYMTLSLYSPSGRLVMDLVKGEQRAGTYTRALDISGLSEGMYFLSLKAGERSVVKKLLLVH